MTTKRQPRQWVYGNPGAFGDAYPARPIEWRPARTEAEKVERLAARKQHELVAALVEDARRAASRQGVAYSARWLAGQVRTMSYDSLWAVLKGRTTMTLVQYYDLRTAWREAQEP